MFLFDRYISIAHALFTSFSKAHHEACIYHVKMNINHKFKTDYCDAEFDLAVYAYRVSEFQYYFEKIKVKDPCIATYLKKISVEKWSRAFFPSIQYNVMNNNYAENFNSKSRYARKFSITIFVELLRFTSQDWFYKRKGLALTCNGPLALDIRKDLRHSF